MDCEPPDKRALPRLSRRPKAAKGPRTEPPLETRQRFRLPQLQSSQTVQTESLRPVRPHATLTSDFELPVVGKTTQMPCYSTGYERMTVLRKTSNSRLLTDAGLCNSEAMTLNNVDAAVPLEAKMSSCAKLKESRMLDRREKAKPTMMPQSENLVSEVFLSPDWTQPLKTRQKTAMTVAPSHKLMKKSSAIRIEPSLLPFEDTFEPRETRSDERMKLLTACGAGVPQEGQVSLGKTDSKDVWIKSKAKNERMKLYDVGRDLSMVSCEDKSERNMETCNARCVSAMCLKVDEPVLFQYDGQIQLMTTPSVESNDQKMNVVKMDTLPEKTEQQMECEDAKIAKQVAKSEALKPCDGKTSAGMPSLKEQIQAKMDEAMKDSMGKWQGRSKESGIDSGSDCTLSKVMMDEKTCEVGTHFFSNWHEDMMESCEVTSESGMESCVESDHDSPLLDIVDLKKETSVTSFEQKTDSAKEIDLHDSKPTMEVFEEKIVRMTPALEVEQKLSWSEKAEERKERVGTPVGLEYETSDESDDENMDIAREVKESTVKPHIDKKVERKIHVSPKEVKDETSQLEAEMKLSWMGRAEKQKERVEIPFESVYETSDESDAAKMTVLHKMQESAVKPSVEKKVERKISCESIKPSVEKKVERKISCETIKAVEKLPSLGSLERKRFVAKEGPEMKLYEKMIMQMSCDEDFGTQIGGHRKGSGRKHQIKEMDESRMTSKKDRNAPKMMMPCGNGNEPRMSSDGHGMQGTRRGERRKDSATSCADRVMDDESENRRKIREALREEKKKVLKAGAAVRTDEDKYRQRVKFQGEKKTTTAARAYKMPQDRQMTDSYRYGVQLAEHADHHSDRIRIKSQSYVDSARVMHVLENRDMEDSETRIPFPGKLKENFRYCDARPNTEADPSAQRAATRRTVRAARREAIFPTSEESSHNAASSSDVPCMAPHPPNMPRKSNIRIKSCKGRTVRKGPSLKETMEKVASQWNQPQPQVEQPSGYGYYEPRPPSQSKKAESRRQTYVSRMKSDGAHKQHQEMKPSSSYRPEKGMPRTSGVHNASPPDTDDVCQAMGYPAANCKDFDDSRERYAGCAPWPVFLESLDSQKR